MAGQPSFSDLETASGHALRRATVSDVLNGKRTRLPPWRLVQAFLEACRAVAAAGRLNVDDLGTTEAWKERWDAAGQGLTDVPFPGGTRSAAQAAVPGGDGVPGGVTGVGGTGTDPHAEAASGAAVPPEMAATPEFAGSLPRLVRDFVGREQELGELRGLLSEQGRSGIAVAVQGLRGVGKTQLALRYIGAYAQSYDLVWWISCSSPEAGLRDMIHDAARLGLTPPPERSGEDIAEALREALRSTADHEPARDGSRYAPWLQEIFNSIREALRRAETYPRWLLVFDDVADPPTIRDVMPQEPGHVLITSSNNRWGASATMIELGVLGREQSVEFLLRRLLSLTTTDAHQLAEAAGDLPVVLEHAADSGLPPGDYLSRLSEDPIGLLSQNLIPGFDVSVTQALRTTVEGLPPDARDLLARLSFFGSAPVPIEVLEGSRHIRGELACGLIADFSRRLAAIQALVRSGLAQVQPQAIRVHKVTQALMRQALRDAGDDRAPRHDAHLLLAAADPGNPDAPQQWPLYRELIAHIDACGIGDCTSAFARQLALHAVAYLQESGEPRSSLELATSMLEQWSAEGQAGRSAAGPDAALLAMRMQVPRARALLTLGRFRESFEVSERAVAAMRAAPGDLSRDMIALGVSRGARFRIQGRFDLALSADREWVTEHQSQLGAEHPQTLRALDLLAGDYALTGNVEAARRTSDEVYRTCKAIYGSDGHLLVLFYRNSLARSARLAGGHGAVSAWGGISEGYAALIRQGVIAESHPAVLRHRIDRLAAAGDADPGGAVPAGLAEELYNVYDLSWQRYGERHELTLAAAVILAALLRRTPGRAGAAARLVTHAERGYAAELGEDHPYSRACQAIRRELAEQAGRFPREPPTDGPEPGPRPSVPDFLPLPL